MKKTVLSAIADATLKSAKKAGNCASVMGLHQPKEPKDLTKRLEKMSR